MIAVRCFNFSSLAATRARSWAERLLALAMLLATSAAALAQEPPVPAPPDSFKFEYAAKIVCGVQSDAKGMRLAKGLYATTVNIHNPNQQPARFFKKLALTFPPPEQRPGKVYAISYDVLRYDEALKVDCEDIQRRLFPNGFPAPYYIEGFVVLQSDQSLDVTAVYSTAVVDKKGRAIEHSSIDVEQIHERKRGDTGTPCLADLIPVADPAGSYCKRLNGNLVVTVKNQGLCAAGESKTKIDFMSHGAITLPTPALAAGASTNLTVNLPGGCFDPDCEFRITVDDGDAVPESNETNNTASGVCKG